MSKFEAQTEENEIEALKARVTLLEHLIGTKQLPIPISHGIHELRVMYNELKQCIRSGDLPKGGSDNDSMLLLGDVYKSRDSALAGVFYVVCHGRDGNIALRCFPTLRYLSPARMDFDGLVRVPNGLR